MCLKEQERREKRSRLIKLILIPLYYIIVIPICVLTLINEPETWLPIIIVAAVPVLYYLSVFKADLLFELEYMLNPNLSHAEPSDWYYFCNQIGGYVILLFGIGFAIYIHCIS
ncbi:MAG: hypothetical protein IJ460_06020 [Clostridia bacterium]|nr:hypothetical protein [Clostridia bacterium]